jgi:hypothetical protein
MKKYAHVGSNIETTFSDGRKYTIKITNDRQCAEANNLIMTGRWKVKPEEKDNE